MLPFSVWLAATRRAGSRTSTHCSPDQPTGLRGRFRRDWPLQWSYLAILKVFPDTGNRSASAGLYAPRRSVMVGSFNPRVAQRDKSKEAKNKPEQQAIPRSEEHTSELQSHLNLVCRL